MKARTRTIFLIVVLIGVLMSCQTAQQVLLGAEEVTPPSIEEEARTETKATSTLQVTYQPATPTTAQAIATSIPVASPEVVGPPSLIPSNLVELTTDNLDKLTVLGEIPYPLIQPDHIVYFMKLSNDGKKLVVISENWQNRKDSLVVWDLITNSPVLIIAEPQNNFSQAFFSPDDSFLWVYRDQSLDRYDLQQGGLMDSFDFPEYSGFGAAISLDGRYFVTGVYQGDSDYSSVRFFQSDSTSPFFTDTIAYMVTSIRFSPDGRMVAGTSAKIGGTVTKIWGLESGIFLMDFYNLDSGPVFSPDSTLVAFAKDNSISIFSTDTWVLKATFQTGMSSSTKLPLFFSANNHVLVIRESDDLVFYPLDSGKAILHLPGEGSMAAYSPNLNMIVTYQHLGNIKLWGVQE